MGALDSLNQQAPGSGHMTQAQGLRRSDRSVTLRILYILIMRVCDRASVHTTWIIIMALLLLHIRRVRAVSVLQYSKFAYEFAYACVGFSLCVRVCALCVSDCAYACVL